MECFGSWFVLITAMAASLKNLLHSCFYLNCYDWLRWLVLASISDVWATLLVKATAEEETFGRTSNVGFDEGESL